jgi:hypothetical protein
MTNLNLGQQFLDHETLGSLHASDYKGQVHEGVEPMERWQEKFGGSGSAIQYKEGDSPTQYVDRMRPDIREKGVQRPIDVVDYGSHQSIKDGHHRAVSAYLEGQGAPVHVRTIDEYIRAAYR